MSKPSSLVAQVQWAPISVLLAVFGAGSCIKPGRSKRRLVSLVEMAAFQSASQVPSPPSSRRRENAMQGGFINRLVTGPRQSIEKPWQFSAAIRRRQTV